METDRIAWPAARCRHRDPGYRRNGRWHAATDQAYRRGYAASCPCSACPDRPRAYRCRPPFFGALHALTIDDGGGGARFSFRLFAAFNVKRVMNAIQHPIPMPPNEIIVHRAARRKIFRKVAPLATGAQDIHYAVHDRTHVSAALAAARLRRWKEWLDNRPLVVRQIARVPQVITIVFRSVLMRPHRRSPLESDRFP